MTKHTSFEAPLSEASPLAFARRTVALRARVDDPRLDRRRHAANLVQWLWAFGSIFGLVVISLWAIATFK